MRTSPAAEVRAYSTVKKRKTDHRVMVKRDIRRRRRYPHSVPDKRACRSSSGVCEPRASQGSALRFESLFRCQEKKKQTIEWWSRGIGVCCSGEVCNIRSAFTNRSVCAPHDADTAPAFFLYIALCLRYANLAYGRGSCLFHCQEKKNRPSGDGLLFLAAE